MKTETLARLSGDFLELRIEKTEAGEYAYVLTDKQNGGTTMADLDYLYSVTLWDKRRFETLARRTVSQRDGAVTVEGAFEGCDFSFTQTFSLSADGRWLDENISLKNESNRAFTLKDVDFGFRKMLLRHRGGWCDHLDEYAVMSLPTRRFRGQRIDRFKTAYAASDLVYSPWDDSEKSSGVKPGYFDEAWTWAGKTGGLLFCKYNQPQIEYTRIRRQELPLPGRGREDVAVVYGGVAIFDGNPERNLIYAPGEAHAFGVTRYTAFNGGYEDACYLYRSHLDAHGHCFPKGYNPPVHWNELYNLGWFAENEEGGIFNDGKPVEVYSLEQLYEEARIAKKAGAECLYLDPGWDIYPGSTIWNEQRLGKLSDFCDTIHEKFGLKVALHLMMTFSSPDEMNEFFCRNADAAIGKAGQPLLYRVCTNDIWVEEKTRRLLKLADAGVDFMMFDFVDYGDSCGEGCMDPTHGHEVPMQKQTHADNILRVIRNVKAHRPQILIETHDRIVGGFTEYHQLYFQHGGELSFDENWGYELMWKPMSDLLSGKALSLYEYNMACSIPLYLHINENSDNENMLVLWWFISTARHLGIGGLQEDDPRYAALQRALQLYHGIKDYFTRGVFYGVEPTAHLHLRETGKQAVLCLYNLTSRTEERTVEIDCAKYGVAAGACRGYDGVGGGVAVDAAQQGDKLVLRTQIKPLSAVIVTIG